MNKTNAVCPMKKLSKLPGGIFGGIINEVRARLLSLLQSKTEMYSDDFGHSFLGLEKIVETKPASDSLLSDSKDYEIDSLYAEHGKFYQNIEKFVPSEKMQELFLYYGGEMVKHLSKCVLDQSENIPIDMSEFSGECMGGFDDILDDITNQYIKQLSYIVLRELKRLDDKYSTDANHYSDDNLENIDKIYGICNFFAGNTKKSTFIHKDFLELVIASGIENTIVEYRIILGEIIKHHGYDKKKIYEFLDNSQKSTLKKAKTSIPQEYLAKGHSWALRVRDRKDTDISKPTVVYNPTVNDLEPTVSQREFSYFSYKFHREMPKIAQDGGYRGCPLLYMKGKNGATKINGILAYRKNIFDGFIAALDQAVNNV